MSNEGSQRYGYLELIKEGNFMPICASGWDDMDARVACRELGHFDGVAAKYISFPLNETNSSWRRRYVGSVGCGGNESSIASCSFTNEIHCGTYERASVICYAKEEDKNTGTSLFGLA